MSDINETEIANRLRGLLGVQCGTDLAETATRLNVSEVSLRMSVDDLAPHPSLDVLMAVVRVFGVDPTWLVAGQYSSAGHREAIEATTAERRAVVERIFHGGTPVSSPTIPSPEPKQRA